MSYLCPDCKIPHDAPGYCPSCLVTHQVTSEFVARIDDKAPSMPPEPRKPLDMELWLLEYQVARAKLLDAMSDAQSWLDRFCYRCNAWVGEDDGCRNNHLAFRSRDGHVYCEGCFCHTAKSEVLNAFQHYGVELQLEAKRLGIEP